MATPVPVKLLGIGGYGLVIEALQDGKPVAVKAVHLTDDNKQAIVDEYKMQTMLAALPPEKGGLNFAQPLGAFECIGAGIYNRVTYERVQKRQYAKGDYTPIPLPPLCDDTTHTYTMGGIEPEVASPIPLAYTVTELLTEIPDTIYTNEPLKWSILLQLTCTLQNAYDTYQFVHNDLSKRNFMLRPYIGKEIVYDIRGIKLSVACHGWLAVMIDLGMATMQKPKLTGASHFEGCCASRLDYDLIRIMMGLWVGLNPSSMPAFLMVFLALHGVRNPDVDDDPSSVAVPFTGVDLLNYMLAPTTYANLALAKIVALEKPGVPTLVSKV